jgi:branched-chain amino acid aminotransferase
MIESVGYVNGDYVPASQVAIPVADPRFAWGAVITDRLRTFKGRPFRLEDHLRRFRLSCELARVPQPRTDAELDRAIRRLIRENWAEHELSVICLAAPGPFLIVHTQPIDKERTASLQRSGVRLVSVKVPQAVDPRIKHRSRLDWWIASEKVRAIDPGAEPLLVEPGTGHARETPTANVLAVLAGVVTSPPSGTILEGISLGVVRELCQKLVVPFAERLFTTNELGTASEVLMTNTTYCVAGVSRLDGRTVPFPGPIFGRLLDAWSEFVGVDLRPQAGC